MNSKNFSIVEAAEQAGLSEDEFKSELFGTVAALMSLREGDHEVTYVAATIDGDEWTLKLNFSVEKGVGIDAIKDRNKPESGVQ